MKCRNLHCSMFYRNPSDEIQTQGKLDLANLMVDLVSKVDEDEILLNSTSSELVASSSRLVWLKAFGVFIGLLGSLVLLTLLTCRRPKQPEEENLAKGATEADHQAEVPHPPGLPVHHGVAQELLKEQGPVRENE